jgi:asparagine synthase (glutamine-hydrolysing)
MCGINAVVSFSGIEDSDRELVHCMNREMVYRGPDGSGIWSDNTVCLGAVRLAIIGVGNGQQPITNETGNVVLVCNGEIYNYQELKESLIGSGHVFKTDTDIEVLVHLYEERGIQFVSHIKGMFAFAIYDSANRCLIFGRDRLGEKPLYYSQQFGKIIVSSEAKAIAINCDQDVSIDDSVLLNTNYCSYPQDPRRTLYREIKRVAPGEYITVGLSSLTRSRYWNGRRNSTYAGTLDDAILEATKLLKQAVQRTMISDVPVAILLSGGIDSSAIAAIAKSQTKQLQAISVGYEGCSRLDERSVARRLANDLGIVLHEIELTKRDFIDCFDKYFEYLDEPIWDPASVMQWYIFKRAREIGLKVLLNGQASDELFFGYPSELIAARHFEGLKKISTYLPVGRRGIRLFLRDLFRSPRLMFRLLRTPSNGEWVSRNLASLNDVDYSLPEGVFWAYVHSGDNPLESRFNFNREVYLPTNGFLQTDKLSMAHSCEVRSPFADADLVDFIQSLPQSFLVGDFEPKWFLKKALAGIVPDYILNLPKQGFQPSDECLHALTKKFTSDENYWIPMTKEVTQRILKNICDRRSEKRKRKSLIAVP